MARSIGEGVNRDLTQEMGNWNPVAEDQEAQDEKKRLNEAGGGIEVGEKYKTVKKRGMVVGMEKVPGEVVKGPAPEAVDRGMNPEEQMIAEESGDETDEVVEKDPMQAVQAQQDVEAERQARRDAEKAAGWSPKKDGGAANEPMVSKAPETLGLRKDVQEKESWWAKFLDRKRSKGDKPKNIERRQSDSLH